MFTIRSGADTSSAREAVDMIIAALSMDIAVAVVFEPSAVEILNLESEYSDRYKKLPMLEDIFDLDTAFLLNLQPPEQSALEDIKTITDHELEQLHSNSKHHICF